MSTFEYNDLFLNCQDTGKYHMFVFDIENSRKMDNSTRYKAQLQMIELSLNMYKRIQEVEKQEDKKILVFEEGFTYFWDDKKDSKNDKHKVEPIIYADTFGITIYRDSLPKEKFISIYEEEKEKLGITFNMHQADGYYETNNYAEGGAKYYRSYCFDLLMNFHKDTYKDVVEALSRKR